MSIFNNSKNVKMKILESNDIVPIVADGAIAERNNLEGRLVPVLLLDTTNRPDLVEAIRIHEDSVSGDMTLRWGQVPSRPDVVVLRIELTYPTKLYFILAFEIVAQGILIESMLHVGCAYIQSAKPGERLKDNLDSPRLIIEIPDTGFRKKWNYLHEKCVYEKFRREKMSKTTSRCQARLYLDEMRKLISLRKK